MAAVLANSLKYFNVSKPVCSITTINPVIFNPTFNLVSNFVSERQSVKLLRKLIDPKRTGNVLMNTLLIRRAIANMVLQNHLVP